MQLRDRAIRLRAARRARRIRRGLGGVALFALVAYSAVVAKQLLVASEVPEPMSVVDDRFRDGDAGLVTEAMAMPNPGELADPLLDGGEPEPVGVLSGGDLDSLRVAPATPSAELPDNAIEDTAVRFFNGRLVRPARVMWMLVTAYSPDERSCAGTADNITASNHHIDTNAHHLVAADTRVLPFGSMISITGYDGGQVVPVLDRGGAIKGNHLDVLFPTHEQARAWGVKKVRITVWGFADGEKADNWRAIRDSKK